MVFSTCKAKARDVNYLSDCLSAQDETHEFLQFMSLLSFHCFPMPALTL